MARGLVRWAHRIGKTETWFAQVELPDGQTTDIAKAEYDAESYSPAFWYLPIRLQSYSSVVTEGMKRLSKDFSARVAPLEYRKTGRRLWTRVSDWSVEAIHLHRGGSSYGAPYSPSVHLRVEVFVHVLNDPLEGNGPIVISDHIRGSDGYRYHHRFNAETWDSYERCVDDLGLFAAEFADPWFANLRVPQNLAEHPSLRGSTRLLLAEAIAGNASPQNVADTLAKYGIRKQKR